MLSGVLLELNGDVLRLTGSDLDLTITVETKVSGQQDGVAVLPGKLASDIARAFGSGAVNVEVTDDVARLSSGRSEFSLRLMHADEYPRFETPDADAVTISSERLASALRQVVRAASSDDSRPILTGVLMAAESGGLRLVATDSYRLAVCDLPGESLLGEGQQVLVPSRALNELAKLLSDASEVTLRLGSRDASFTVGDVLLTTRLIEGDFPNYRSLIPENHPNKLTVDREPLLEALRRVRLLAQEATPVRVHMSGDTVELKAITQDVGEAHEEIDAQYVGQDLMVAFNPQYLLDGLTGVQSENALLGFVAPTKPAVITGVPSEEGERPDFRYLVMPLRVS